PADIPQSIKLCHTETSFTLHDLYPKSLYHEVVIPLIRPPLTVDGLRDLRSLLSLPTEVAKTVLLNLRRDALEAKRLIEDDMRKRYSAVWDVQIGFHALPSVQHLHLHVMSTDFTGLYFKNKKHLNSFHPDAGFFLKIDEVLEWFDLPQAEFARKARIDKKEHEALLKQDLKCPGCNAPFRSMTTVRKHLTEKHEK
ncbi:HIT-like domain-containing protein, partial [Trametes maxima]